MFGADFSVFDFWTFAIVLGGMGNLSGRESTTLCWDLGAFERVRAEKREAVGAHSVQLVDLWWWIHPVLWASGALCLIGTTGALRLIVCGTLWLAVGSQGLVV